MTTEKKIDFVLVDSNEDVDNGTRAGLRLAKEMGTHASKEARDAMLRVLRTVPHGEQTPAAAIAYGDILWHIESIVRELDKAAPGFAKAVADIKGIMEQHRGEDFRKYAEVGLRQFGFIP